MGAKCLYTAMFLKDAKYYLLVIAYSKIIIMTMTMTMTMAMTGMMMNEMTINGISCYTNPDCFKFITA